MNITYLGGAETVTGSKFLLQTKQTKVLVDCGLFQGYKWLRQRNWHTPAFDVEKLDAILLTHAHLDHSGYIPVLYKNNFRGPVYTHHASKDLCEILLADSGHIQEEDAKYLGRHHLSKHENPQPLYDRATAEKSMELFEGIEFNERVQIGDIEFYLQPAGHILGAASIIVHAEGQVIGFSGDVGRSNDLFMREPKPLPEVDHLLLESTYGNRRHEPIDPAQQLADVVNATVAKGGTLLIPSFAVGRAQILQHLLATLMDQGRIPKLPVYLDSPMAISVSDLYCHYADFHRLSKAQCAHMCDVVTYTRAVDESKALADITYPHVIIAGSGMATGGRILHHMKRLLGDHRTTLLFAGYQAGGTRGAKMLAGMESVKIHGQWWPVKAAIQMISGLSGHADYTEIQQWLEHSALRNDTRIHLVHGDPETLDAHCDHLRQSTPYKIDIADYRGILHF
jgi:metallo-beta-lactamase family protein